MVPDEWPIASPSEDDGGYPARSAGRRRLPTVRKDFFLDPRDRLTEQERALMTAMLAELLGTIAVINARSCSVSLSRGSRKKSLRTVGKRRRPADRAG